MNTFIYLFSIIGFGLLQIWALLLFLLFKNVKFSYWDLIKDGGLFVFATSLAVVSFINHLKLIARIGTKEIIVSFSISVVVLIICMIGYISAIQITKENLSFEFQINQTHNIVQLVGSGFALLYGLFVEGRLQRYIRSK